MLLQGNTAQARKYATLCQELAEEFDFTLWKLRGTLALWLAGDSIQNLKWPENLKCEFLFDIEAHVVKNLAAGRLPAAEEVIRTLPISKLIIRRIIESSSTKALSIELKGKPLWFGTADQINLKTVNLRAAWDSDNADLILENRILSIKDRPLIAKILTVMLEGKVDWNKEDLVTAIWNENYNPLVHDTRVYTLIKRSREFLESELGTPKALPIIEKLDSGYRFNPQVLIGRVVRNRALTTESFPTSL